MVWFEAPTVTEISDNAEATSGHVLEACGQLTMSKTGAM